MFTVLTTEAFSDWLDRIGDRQTQRRLATRLRKAEFGNFGDVKSVGEGVMEMREHFGPGWRMYYVQRETTVIMMLGGGEKDTQTRDLAAAKRLVETLED